MTFLDLVRTHGVRREEEEATLSTQEEGIDHWHLRQQKGRGQRSVEQGQG